jgi:hypothetical protein
VDWWRRDKYFRALRALSGGIVLEESVDLSSDKLLMMMMMMMMMWIGGAEINPYGSACTLRCSGILLPLPEPEQRSSVTLPNSSS